MNDTIVILEESHRELVDAVTTFYSKEFDKTWGDVLAGVRKSQQWQPLSDEIKSVLHAYKPQFRRLRKRECELFEDMDRMQGLSLCEELHQLHQNLEEAMYEEFVCRVGLSDSQADILLDSGDYRLKKLHNAHRAIRLAIDQSQIILGDANSKTGRSDIDLLKVASDEASLFYEGIRAQLSGKPKPVQN